jgi:hypothetical protein
MKESDMFSTHSHLRLQPVVSSRPRPDARFGKRQDSLITSVLVEPEVETVTPKPTDAAKLEQQLTSSPVPQGQDPWEDSKWTQYKVRTKQHATAVLSPRYTSSRPYPATAAPPSCWCCCAETPHSTHMHLAVCPASALSSPSNQPHAPSAFNPVIISH